MSSLLLLDNHDSFTWNLVELLRSIGKDNFKIFTPEHLNIRDLQQYDQVIFSPGPGLPREQPAMFDILDSVESLWNEGGKRISVFGVCLGMQAIAIHFGGSLLNLTDVVHGQPRKLKVLRPGHPVFTGIPDECDVGLYHSWAVDAETLPGCLETLATTSDGTIMALAHKTLPICGVQFHPESIMTPSGKQMIGNWLKT
ncbi:MAG: aminodeoxychorismate/anthranilate synthase component II [Bacteroidetes bacterium]|nr:aminodeoxychorismate/anthranilate synthase component II [Bacteroidota bacterium]